MTVDYAMPFEEMIAAGDYDWVSMDIHERRFPIQGQGVVEVETRIFSFDVRTASKEAVQLIEAHDRAHPWASARLEHLLAYPAYFTPGLKKNRRPAR